MAAIQIQWAPIASVLPVAQTTTGKSAEQLEEEQQASIFEKLDKPTVVFVEGGNADFDFEKLEELVFKNEKVGLGMKAFHALKVAPHELDDYAEIREEGKTMPRILVIDPTKQKIRVLEAKKIKAGALYKMMKSVAGSCYKEKLDALVKKHLKLLTEQDKLYGEQKTLNEKIGRLKKDGDKAAKKLKKLETEMEELMASIRQLGEDQKEVWKLTPKGKKATKA